MRDIPDPRKGGRWFSFPVSSKSMWHTRTHTRAVGALACVSTAGVKKAMRGQGGLN